MQGLDIDKKPLIILTGPTAVGKTDLSIKLAKAIGGEIISADSAQVYKGLDIGSAKVTTEEMDGIPHHLIDVYEPGFSFDVTVFKEEARKAVEEIYSRERIPIVVGGTGFYIQALLYDISFDADDSVGAYLDDFENDIRNICIDKGLIKSDEPLSFREILERSNEIDMAYGKLSEIDPDSTEIIHKNNFRKVIRALEFYHFYGEPISAHNSREKEKESAYNSFYFVLTMNRELLYERINKRVDIMMSNGLVDEVKSLIAKGLTRDMTSMQAIGYKEIYDALDKLSDESNSLSEEELLEEAAEQIKLNTRHFAKRQLTWFRREKDVIWLDRDEFSENYALSSYEADDNILKYIIKIIKCDG